MRLLWGAEALFQSLDLLQWVKEYTAIQFCGLEDALVA
jgi:hypothetical protein